MSKQATLAAVPDLTPLRVSNGALKGEQLPKEIKLLNWGDNPSVKGNIRVGTQTANVLPANQRKLGYERVAIDYNHCTVPGSPEFVKGQPKAIFGYGKPEVRADDGVYLTEITWTPLGVEHARNYEDQSPAVHCDPDQEVDFMSSVALTPNGCLHDITFHSATPGNQPTKPNMSEQNNMANVITLAAFAGAMGLPAAASEAEVMAKVTELTALNGQLTTLSARVENLDKVIEQLTQKQTDAAKAALDAERAAVITTLSASGKAPVNPKTGKAFTAEELQGLDLPTLQVLSANAPKVVPLSAGQPVVSDKPATALLKGRDRMIAAFEATNQKAK